MDEKHVTRVLLTDDPDFVRRIAAHHVENARLCEVAGCLPCYSGFWSGVPVTVIFGGHSRAQTLDTMDRLFSAEGAEHIYFLSSADKPIKRSLEPAVETALRSLSLL